MKDIIVVVVVFVVVVILACHLYTWNNAYL